MEIPLFKFFYSLKSCEVHQNQPIKQVSWVETRRRRKRPKILIQSKKKAHPKSNRKKMTHFRESKKKKRDEKDSSKTKSSSSKNTRVIDSQDKELTSNFIENFDSSKKWSFSELSGLKKELETSLKNTLKSITSREEESKRMLEKFKDDDVEDVDEESSDGEELDESEPPSDEDKKHPASQSEFWNYVETYFVPITQEKLNILAPKNIKPESILEIPSVGRHYSEQWNEEDAQLFYDSDGDRPRKKSNVLKFDDLLNLDSSAETIESHSLTQRLLSSLFEEKRKKEYVGGHEDPYDMQEPNIGSHDYTPHALQYFEDKVIKELKALGIVTTELDVKNKHDEICVEIQNVQDQLKELHAKNEETRANLYNKVKDVLGLEKKMQKRWQDVKQIDKEYKATEKKKKRV